VAKKSRQHVKIRSAARARLYNDSGQVVHTHVPRRRQSSFYGVVELGTFTIDSESVAWWSNGRASDLPSRGRASSIREQSMAV